YRSRKAEERASPGYYRVVLKDAGVEAELTATARVGLHRYRFAGGPAHLLVDLAHGYHDPEPPMAKVSEAFFAQRGDDLLVGRRRVHEWADGRAIFFAMKLSRPFKTVRFYANDRPLAEGLSEAHGADLKCVLDYGDPGPEPLLVKVALSAV